LLVNNTNGRLLGSDPDTLDVIGSLTYLLQLSMNNVRRLHGGLRMELGGVGNLEKNILHDVRAIWNLELERLALNDDTVQSQVVEVDGYASYLEEDIVEAPSLRSQNGRQALLALLDQESKVNSTRAGVTSSPGLAGTGIGCMAVGTEGLAINPSLGDSVDGLLAVEAPFKRC
jgi:hypothetical protein